MSVNDIDLVRQVVTALQDSGLRSCIIGGWGEELHGLRPPCQHGDIDLLLLDPNIEVLDAFLRRAEEVTQKRFPHKRAIEVADVLVELFLTKIEDRRFVTDFWGSERQRLEWPRNLVSTIRGLPVASASALRIHRARHQIIQRERRIYLRANWQLGCTGLPLEGWTIEQALRPTA